MVRPGHLVASLHHLTDSHHVLPDENCVGLLEWFDEDGKVLLIMELLTGAQSQRRFHSAAANCVNAAAVPQIDSLGRLASAWLSILVMSHVPCVLLDAFDSSRAAQVECCSTGSWRAGSTARRTLALLSTNSFTVRVPSLLT